MNDVITVVRSNFISDRQRFWNDFFNPIKYDLTISCPEGTIYYTVCKIENELIFFQVEKIRQNTIKRSIQFDSLELEIRKDFLKSIYPSISEDDLLKKLYGTKIAEFLIDKTHFVYSFEITAQLLAELGEYKTVISADTSPSLKENKVFEIDGKWSVTISIKDGIHSKQVAIVAIKELKEIPDNV